MSLAAPTIRGIALPRRTTSRRAVAQLRHLNAEEWDGLRRPGQGALAHGYLRAWERVELAGLTSRPVVADASDGALLAAAPGYLYDLDPGCLRHAQAPALLQRLRAHRERLLMVRVYELGAPAALSEPLLHDPRLSCADAARLLLPRAVAAAERERAHVLVVQDFPHGDHRCSEVLAQHGFARVPILPTAVLELGFDSFREYLESMRAHYRRRARLVLRRSAELEVERHQDFSAMAGDLARLARKVFDRAQEIRREILTEEYFLGASREDCCSLLVLRRGDGSIASFALLIDDRPWLQFVNCGFEAEAGRGEGAYFRLLYEIVRTGIDEGYGRINFGMTTLRPKLDTGALPIPLVAWMRHRRPLIQKLAAVAGTRLMAADPLAPRNVFKDPARRSVPAPVLTGAT